MYNYSFYCTYLDISNNEHKQDTIYRKEILKAFNLMIYDHEKMMNTIIIYIVNIKKIFKLKKY